MAEQTYQIMFRGQIAPDTRMEDVKIKLAKLFKTDPAKIERMFSGGAIILKKGLGQQESARYKDLIEKTGALCEVHPETGTDRPKSPAQSVSQAPSPSPAAPEKGGPGTRSEKEAAAKSATSRLKHHADTVREKVKAVQGGDLKQTLETIRDKVQEIDTEEAGRKVTSLVGGITASARADLGRGGIAALTKNKMLWGVAGTVLILIVAFAVFMRGATAPLPIDVEVINKFSAQYNRELRKRDLANARTSELIGLTRELEEDMGYNYNRTLQLWLLRRDLVERVEALPVYTAILVEPVSVAIAADLSGLDEHLAADTYQIFELVAAIPTGADLETIRMIKACPSDGNLLKHDDLLRVLQDNAVPIDAGQPDLAIADAFFGLEQAGLIKIQRRWDNDTQFSDIEILDRETMNTLEGQLQELNALKAELAGG